MIVRKYARRTRCSTRSCPDTTLLGDEDSDFSQENSQDPFSNPFSSSQDSSHWSLDPDLTPSFSFDDLPCPSDSSRPGKRKRGLKRGEDKSKNPVVGPTATLMEAQEFGEMMEHVDEVNFALDGLRLGQPARIRRASLLSLLSICGTVQQRRLLRAQGMARRIVDAILGLTFDDSPSTVAAAALFFVLASDLQDDHLLDSPSCIRFLLKLLNPPPDTVEKKALGIGSKLLGIHNLHTLNGSDKRLDSSSRAIISKVREILVNCEEIKLGSGDDEETERPELSSKWISLLTIEKACLSTVSFEDTSDTVRRTEGNFKERLRELGGLDAIFDVIASCHSTMEGWLKNKSPSVPDLKDGVALKSLVLILRCLKIMENATFLSKDNQDHLLGMKGKLDSQGFPQSFVRVILRAIVSFSGLKLSARGNCSTSISCNGALTGLSGESCVNANGLILNKNSKVLKVSSVEASNGRAMKANAAKMDANSYDPFAFDEDDIEPSKWELATKKEPSQTHQSDILHREFEDGCNQQIMDIDQEFSQLTNEEFPLSCSSPCPTVAEEDSKLLEDCLLSAIKVLMNLTNDNPEGCQQIADCCGMDTMASLIVSHFPSFYLCFPFHIQSKKNVAAPKRSIGDGHLNHKHLSDHELDFLVAILGLLVNLVEKDSQNRSRLASASISVEQPGSSKSKENPRDVITLLCSMFLANQGVGEASEEEKLAICDEASLLQGEREAEMMIVEAYVALLLAFLSTESTTVREAIASCLPNHNLEVLVPVLERFVAFHLTLNMISPETHSTVVKVIESCKGP